MAISTNSIIHYTNSMEAIQGILTEGFKIKYCFESIAFVKGKTSKAAHPMLSFCDIPLSNSKQHFESYGKYGIGLSKEWASNNGINPVIYINKSSFFAETILKLVHEIDNPSLSEDLKSNILRIICNAKNYSGKLERNGSINNNYKFYDEREWRLVPTDEMLNNASFIVTGRKYQENKELYNKRLESFRITFEANDISYIIVRHTSEIPIMVECIRKQFKKRCDAEELDVLFSKICSTDQIIADY